LLSRGFKKLPSPTVISVLSLEFSGDVAPRGKGQMIFNPYLTLLNHKWQSSIQTLVLDRGGLVVSVFHLNALITFCVRVLSVCKELLSPLELLPIYVQTPEKQWK
jgi:hypothetical protein